MLKNKQFGLADLETVRKMLWVAKRDNMGVLEEEDIKNFPSRDLITINQLWLSASKGKFGFSVQKQIWIAEGGSLRACDFEMSIFERFILKVEWEVNKIVLDSRAAKGHLPLGVYALSSKNWELYTKWWAEIEKIREKEELKREEELEKIREIVRKFERRDGLREKIEVLREVLCRWYSMIYDFIFRVRFCRDPYFVDDETSPPTWFFLLSRTDV
ncbi:MAG: GUN4 domain-containing protein [Fischerella sp. CENA71]|nr:GUN4 domain-containing protein [Fischerella sp. CENA71]